MDTAIKMVKVSVIIPVYKVEDFIGRCAESLMNQTLREVEYIFVNDATPDGSMQILQTVLERYRDRKEQICIVTHEINKGLPAARNTGLAAAQGEYIFHCDSDDYVEPDMLERLYNKAEKENADIVWCDWFLTFEKTERYMRQPDYGTPMEALKAMLGGAMKFNVWNKLARRSLYVDNDIKFPSGYGMGEDMTMMLLFARAYKVAYLPQAFYHYVKLNINAISQTCSEKHLGELKHNVAIVEHKLQEMFGNVLDRDIAFLKLEVKFPFLLSGDYEIYRLWKKWYPEVNRYILENHHISVRSRLIQWCAWKHLDVIVWIYRWLMEKVIYGGVYR